MDINTVSRTLLVKLGGASNIVTNDACASRLRVSVRSMDCVDVEAIRNIDGVMGVVESDTLQIVFGPGVVNEVLDAFVELTGIPKGARSDSDVNVRAARNKSVRDAKRGGVVRGMLKHVANVFVPLLPGIVAAGLINGLTNVVNVWTHGTVSGAWWYESIRSLSWALFAYLPIFAGYNAAREFGGSPILGGIVGALCVANSSMPLLQEYGGNSVILPMTGDPYNPAHGGLVAALLAGGACAWLERHIRKVMPSLVDTFASPLITLVVMGFAVVVALQPLGDVLTSGVYAAMEFVYSGLGVLGGYVLAAGFLPLVSVGLHTALTPIHAMLNDPSGPTGGINYLLPVLMMAGGGQVGAGAALYLKSKNQKLKGYVRDAIPVGVLGVGEPLMYAVTLPLGRPFVTACLGAGVGGVIATALHVGAVSQGASGIFGVLIVQPNQQVAYVVALLGAAIGGFVLTWFFGVDDERIDEVYPPVP